MATARLLLLGDVEDSEVHGEPVAARCREIIASMRGNKVCNSIGSSGLYNGERPCLKRISHVVISEEDLCCVRHDTLVTWAPDMSTEGIVDATDFTARVLLGQLLRAVLAGNPDARIFVIDNEGHGPGQELQYVLGDIFPAVRHSAAT